MRSCPEARSTRREHAFTSSTSANPPSAVAHTRSAGADAHRLGDQELNSLFRSLERSGCWRRALTLFLQRAGAPDATEPDPRLATSAIAIAARNAKPLSAVSILRWMERSRSCPPNVVSYTSAIRGLSESGKWRHCRDLLGRMRDRSIEPNKQTYAALLKACERGSSSESLDFASHLLHDIDRRKVEPDIALLTAMVAILGEARNAHAVRQLQNTMCTKRGNIDPKALTALARAHAKCGDLRRALRTLRITRDHKHTPSVHVYTAIMQSLAQHGRLRKAVALYEDMRQQSSVLPSERMYTVIMHVFDRLGRTEEVERLANELLTEHTHLFNVYHLNVLLSALSKDGRWRESFSWIQRAKRLRVMPDRVTHETAMLSLGIAGETSRAEEYISTLEHAGLQLCDYAYVGLIEALWRGGRWRDALQVPTRMRRRGVAETVHTFNATMQACESVRAYDKILELYEDMRKSDIAEDKLTTAMVGIAAKEGANDVEVQQQWSAAASAAAAAVGSILLRFGVF